MVNFATIAVIISLTISQGHCSESCSDSATSLLQTVADVQKRGPAVPATVAQQSATSGSLLEGIRESDAKTKAKAKMPIEPAFNVQHGLHTQDAAIRTTEEVLATCIAVISTVAIGWLAFAALTRGGQSMPILRLVLLISSFGICSWGMNVVNKSLVMDFGTPTLISGAQMAMAAMGVIIMAPGSVTGDPAQMFKWCVVPCIFCAMMVSSFCTFEYLTLSMMMIIRNLGPVITLPIEMGVMPSDKRPCLTAQMLLSMIVIAVGTSIYVGRIDVSLRGIGLALVNMVLAVADRIAQRRLLTTECQDLSIETCMVLNNVLGLIPCFVLAFHWGEFDIADTNKWFFSFSTFLLILSGIIGTGICYFAIAVQREITASSFMLLQNVVRVAVATAGVIIFLDPIGWPFQVVGMVLSFIGALWYGKAQIDGAMIRSQELRQAESSSKEPAASERAPLINKNQTKSSARKM